MEHWYCIITCGEVGFGPVSIYFSPNYWLLHQNLTFKIRLAYLDASLLWKGKKLDAHLLTMVVKFGLVWFY